MGVGVGVGVGKAVAPTATIDHDYLKDRRVGRRMKAGFETRRCLALLHTLLAEFCNAVDASDRS